MPGGDGTGPMGQGPRTGRGVGFCAGYNTPGYANPGPRFGFGRGFGRGLGRGFGWRRFAYREPVRRLVPIQQDINPVYPQQPYQPTKEQEKQYLENELKYLEEEQKALNQELEAIKKKLEELNK